MSNRWFRFYDEALNDPKVQMLKPEIFKAWVNLLCLASKGGGSLPAVEDIAFALRVSVDKAEEIIEILVASKLIDRSDKGLNPHKWDTYQYPSDSSAERMRRHRAKSVTDNVTSRVTADVTSRTRTSDAPDTDTDTDTDIEVYPPISPLAKPPAKTKPIEPKKAKGRIPVGDWYPNSELIHWANGLGVNALIEYEQMKAWAESNDKRKADWPATYRNWCIKSSKDRAKGAQNGRQNRGNENGFLSYLRELNSEQPPQG